MAVIRARGGDWREFIAGRVDLTDDAIATAVASARVRVHKELK